MNFRGLSTRSLVLITLCALFPSTASAHLPSPAARPLARPMGARDLSLDRRLDLNRLSLVTTNLGSLGFDLVAANAGAWYPRGTDPTLLFASGLWIGAITQGETRVAVAEYSMEYAPGTHQLGIIGDPNDPAYSVWKVRRWTGVDSDTIHIENPSPHTSIDPLVHHSWAEYRANAIPKGAPWKLHRLPDMSTPAPNDSVDVPGPDVIGDVMTWCVFNDADPAQHTNNAGGTAPLGAEVQQTVFSFGHSGPMGDVVFIRWRVRNGGNATWTAFRAGFWTDPDLGGFTDDKTGCDTTRSLAYAYNGVPNDPVYGAAPPALGVVMLATSPAPDPGTTSGLHAVRSYINGTDPQSFVETYHSLAGLAADGSELLDHLGQPTRYHYYGDPLAGTGWLDPSNADKRLLASAAPRDIAPGETFEMWVALVVAPEAGIPQALAGLRCRTDYVRDVFASGFAQPFPPAENCSVPLNCPRPANYWSMQALGGGVYPPADMAQLATLVNFQSVALNLDGDALANLADVLSPPGDVREQALREHAAFLCNMTAMNHNLQPPGEPPVILNPLTPVNCPGLPALTIGELATKAAETRTVSGAYRNFIFDHRRALDGVDAGLPGFGGGAGAAFDFFGSTLDPFSQPDSFPQTVHVLFDHAVTQKAHRYLRLEVVGSGAIPPQGRGYLYGGHVDVPFTVRDSITGEQLVAAFVERCVTDEFGTILPPASQPASFDSTWAPTDDAVGGREYLFVFRRPYSDPPQPEFQVDGVVADGSLPGLFALWSRLRSPADVIDDGDAFAFLFQFAFTPGADAILLELAGQPLSDPEVAARYQQIAHCLGAINRGETVGTTCDAPTNALASLVLAEAEPGRARVEWYVSADVAVTIERRVDDDAWRDHLATSPDGSGRVVLIDTGVEAGHRYRYRLRMAGVFAGEVSLEVPSQHRLTLAGFHPNPATGPLSVALSLASTAPARLEILDVAGRRVHASTIGRPVPGPQQIALSGLKLAPGVYVLRLEQSGVRLVTRSIVLR